MRMSRPWRFCVPLLIALAAFAAPAGAAVFNIAAGDVPGLIAAVNAANTTAEPDTINLAAGTYTLITPQADQTGLPEITTDIQIVGAGSGTTVLTRNSGNPIFRLIKVASTGRLRLEGLTVSGGQTNQLGGAIRSAGDLTVVNCVLTDNHVFTNVGGAIFHASGAGGGLRIEGTTLSQNSAETGGAIYVAGPFTMRNSQVLSNSASLRAAVSWTNVDDGDVARIEDSLIQGTDNSGIAALVSPGRGAILQIVRSTIDGNQRGGLLLGGESLWAFVTDTTISNNTSNS